MSLLLFLTILSALLTTIRQILQYALTLEHLENSFYSTFLQQFTEEDFAAAGHLPAVRGRFGQIAEHEAVHVSILSGALGAQAVHPCTYKFPVTDVNSFTALAAVLESVGVSAYLGAAASIVDKTTLVVAGSILTTEARHQAWVNAAVVKQTPWSGPFDTPLSFNEVFSLASSFITECPASNPPLPFQAFPALTITPDGAITTTAKLDGTFVQLITGLGSQTYKVENGKVTIPAVQGISYAVLTTSSDSAHVNDG